MMFRRVVKSLGGALLVLFASLALSPFSGVTDLTFGTLFMAFGVVCGYGVEVRYERYLVVLGIISSLVVMGLYFMENFALAYVQYFFGGFMIYFACCLTVSAMKK